MMVHDRALEVPDDVFAGWPTSGDIVGNSPPDRFFTDDPYVVQAIIRCATVLKKLFGYDDGRTVLRI